MFQQVILIGYLGSDPEMRYTGTGTPVTNFRLAVSRQWTGQDGQRQDKTVWFKVTCWRRTAEIVSQYLSKGRQVMVVGEIEEANAYIDRDGNPRASLEVTAFNVKFLGGRNDDMSGGYGAPTMGNNQMGGYGAPAMGGNQMGGAPSMAPMQQQPPASQYPVPPQQSVPQQSVPQQPVPQQPAPQPSVPPQPPAPQQPIQPAAPTGGGPVIHEEDIPF